MANRHGKTPDPGNQARPIRHTHTHPSACNSPARPHNRPPHQGKHQGKRPGPGNLTRASPHPHTPAWTASPPPDRSRARVGAAKCRFEHTTPHQDSEWWEGVPQKSTGRQACPLSPQ
eukprot:14383474-Alexandrium_andersonii.AAC.1